MSRITWTSTQYFLRACIWICLVLYILYLYKSGSIVYYIAPRMLIFVKIAVIGLFILAVFQTDIAIRSLKRQEISCGCEAVPSRSIGKNVAIYGLFVLPLLLGFFLPNTAMSSSLAAKKGVNVGGNNVTFLANQFNQDFAKLGIKLYQQDTIELGDELYLEKLQTLDSFVDNFLGKEIRLTGFVYRDPELGQNQLIVGRFAITCCTADASTYGVIVESSEASQLPEDMWVTVTGTIERAKHKGTDVWKVMGTHFEKINAPSNPYVYPNYDFGSQL
ncbi:TIGR03943 family protein [Brevibacillus reuszeri]|uniref:TIGR03943 family protein n=1 Tax=Brevibacillus reuszeri TaxID=54915 RepID=A0A0K9YPI2_9BACL|nr:TIGR03943 family protein [Brevibacillus reuszeri]KNB70628.1 hypothetical protein ADS79_17180 [Brevibacillus reuszeri]MED1861385.1 TIGR03943 family protein [Brevibacillus reuszeri]GED69926.1 TIGR03943 family protein [Brevibacillus reuszeri]